MENLQTQGISLPKKQTSARFPHAGRATRCRTAAVESALGLGYRHLDTAEMYANEEPSIWRAACRLACGSARKDLHITTKVWSSENLAPGAGRRAFGRFTWKSFGSIKSISIWCIGRRRA